MVNKVRQSGGNEPVDMSRRAHTYNDGAYILLFLFMYLFVQNYEQILPPRCLRKLQHTEPMTSDFEAHLQLLTT